MAEKAQGTKQINEAAHKRPTSAPALQVPVASKEQHTLTAAVQRAVANPHLASPADILSLQRMAGSRAVTRLIQTKLGCTQCADDEGLVQTQSAPGRRPAVDPAVQAQVETLPVRRKVMVHDPSGKPASAPPSETNEKIIKDYVTTLCPSFTVVAGEVKPNTPALCPVTSGGAMPEACGCLCRMHALRDPGTGAEITWTIVINDKDWPQTDRATRTVTVHSPFSGVQFGAWSKGPPAHRMSQANWLVLGHELCGHADLFARGLHPTGPPPTHGGRPSHDVTVAIENKIAAEHGIPPSELRGLFADPHHGESMGKVTVAEFPRGSTNVSALPPVQQHQLDIAEAFIKSAPVKMDIIGHADQLSKSAGANQSVAKRRADNVRAELGSRGISASRFMAVKGIGAAECSIPGDQPSCRKVDIYMFIMEGASETHS